jgi:hypothetical protein
MSPVSVTGVVVAINVADKGVVIVVPVASSPPAVTGIVVAVNVVDESVVSVVPVTMSIVSMSWVVVTLNIHKVLIGVVGPVSVSPVAVAGIVMSIKIDNVVSGLVVVPVTVSPPAVVRIVVSLDVDKVRINLLSFVVIPVSVSVDVVGNNSGWVVNNNSVVLSSVVEESSVSPVSMAWVVMSINVVDDGVVLVGPVTMSPVAVSGVIVAIDVADDSVVLVVEVTTSPVSVSGIVVTLNVAHESVIFIVPVVVSPVSMAWVVVALDIDDVLIDFVGPVAVSPVAVAWVVVSLNVDKVVLGGIIGSPVAVSPVSVARVVVALSIDQVGVNSLAIVVVPDTMSVDVVSNDGGSVDDCSWVVNNVGVVLLELVSPVAMSPVAMSRVVATLNIVSVVLSLRELVSGNAVLHLAAQEDLGESKTDGVTVLIEVLVVPLSLGIHDLVVDVLTVDDEVVLNMEDEVPGVGEGLGHLAELVKIGADSGLALLELVGDIVDDVTEILDSVKDRVEGSVLELINDTAEALPDVLGITEALDTVRNLSLNSASEHTLEDLAHAEESEVHVRALHGLEVVHLLVLLVIDLIEKLLPVVIEIEEEFFVVDHLGLTVKEHGSGLTEVLSGINPLAHAVVMETLTSILEDVHTVDDERLVGLKEDLLRMEESLSHTLDLLVVMMINLTAVVEHVTNVGDSKTKLVDGLGGLLI